MPDPTDRADKDAQLDRQVPAPSMPKLPRLAADASKAEWDALERRILDRHQQRVAHAAARAHHRRVLDQGG